MPTQSPFRPNSEVSCSHRSAMMSTLPIRCLGTAPSTWYWCPALFHIWNIGGANPPMPAGCVALANPRASCCSKSAAPLSDRVDHQPGMDARMDDVRAVMDAVGVERAAIMGVSEAGSLASLFAATHPERCQALILYGKPGGEARKGAQCPVSRAAILSLR